MLSRQRETSTAALNVPGIPGNPNVGILGLHQDSSINLVVFTFSYCILASL